MTDAVWSFAGHAAKATLADAPPEAIAAAKTYLLDSLGVGVVGSAAPFVDELAKALAPFGAPSGPGTARVLASGKRLPAPEAAVANAFQIHNSEFDCVHEAAVVHPMAVLLGAMTAYADAHGGVTGTAFLTALVVGVDIAAGIGVASNAPLKFFRPATAGGLGAAAALARLKGLDEAGIVRAMSAAYGQLGGTMQAHTEGKGLLAMQVGFNARNALLAVELAARGVDAPENVLEGPFGYFQNFEGEYDLTAVAASLGKVWRITAVAHKPFPSGRATHGIVDGALSLKEAHGIDAADIKSVRAQTPSLTHRLIGRPAKADMTPNYARLSGQYAVASALITGGLGIEDFQRPALDTPARLELAKRVLIEIDDNPDPNALAPVAIEIELTSGERHKTEVTAVYGAPANPMTEKAHLAKFRNNFAVARPPLPADQADALIAMIRHIEDVHDIRSMLDKCVVRPEGRP